MSHGIKADLMDARLMASNQGIFPHLSSKKIAVKTALFTKKSDIIWKNYKDGDYE